MIVQAIRAFENDSDLFIGEIFAPSLAFDFSDNRFRTLAGSHKRLSPLGLSIAESSPNFCPKLFTFD